MDTPEWAIAVSVSDQDKFIPFSIGRVTTDVTTRQNKWSEQEIVHQYVAHQQGGLFEDLATHLTKRGKPLKSIAIIGISS